MKKAIRSLLLLLNLKAIDLTRTKEIEFKALSSNIIKDNNLLIKTLVEHPKLIERPIIIKGQKAVLGRNTSKIDEII